MGTALTEDHLALLWRMSDVPILCFDGDAAGLRAAERAAGIVLPLLQPGKSVRIATLPEGLDPDDLIKQQGRNTFADVLDRARSLSDMIWSMETGGIVPETPEARAALEARLRERAGSIGDQSVRRHYMQAFDEKLAAFFQPIRPASRYDGRRDDRRNGSRRNGYGQQRVQSPRLVVSDTLRNSRLLKPARTEASPREAVILMSLINHPALAESRLEPLAGLEFGSPAARKLFSRAARPADGPIMTSPAPICGKSSGRADSGLKSSAWRDCWRGQGVWQIPRRGCRARRGNRPPPRAGLALQVG